jgi:hypothetical protein
MKKRTLWIITLLWMLGILFPLAALGSSWDVFGQVFDRVFSPGWMHVLMHALLYAVLGFLLARLVSPAGWKGVLLACCLCLLAGILHESIQVLALGFFPGLGAELFDLGVDLAGGTAGVFAARGLKGRAA